MRKVKLILQNDKVYKKPTDMNTEFDTLLEEDVKLTVKDTDEQCLVLHNDEYNTFDWVIKSLIEICKVNAEQAEQLTLLIHFKGKAKVKKGDFNLLKPLKEEFINRGIGATID